jgi:molybdate transport system substrate-binding protein
MRRTLVGATVVALGIAGCGDSTKTSSSSSSGPLVVSAAASLKQAFTAYGNQFGSVRYSFAGSDELAAQIRQGAKPDVFASANTKLPQALYGEGQTGKPVVFAGNRLVLAVPAKSAKVSSLDDLAKPGVKIATGSATVPVGSYTRQVLARLPAGQRKAIMANVRSQEPDVKGVVGKLTQGAVDAGFVYITDVKATKGALKAIELPKSTKPSAAYGAVVVKGAKHPANAKKFVAGLVNGQGKQDLLDAGFEPPPGK